MYTYHDDLKQLHPGSPDHSVIDSSDRSGLPLKNTHNIKPQEHMYWDHVYPNSTL